MDLKYKIKVALIWVFAALAVLASVALMFWVGSLNYQTNINEVQLNTTAEEKAADLTQLFVDFKPEQQANSIVIDDTVTDNEPTEAAYGEIIYEQQGSLTEQFAKFDEYIKSKSYTAYGTDESVYYNSHFNEDKAYIKTKYTLNEDALVVEYSFEQSDLCNAQDRCAYLPNQAESTKTNFSEIGSLQVTQIKVINVDDSSYIASLEDQDLQ